MPQAQENVVQLFLLMIEDTAPLTLWIEVFGTFTPSTVAVMGAMYDDLNETICIPFTISTHAALFRDWLSINYPQHVRAFDCAYGEWGMRF